MDGRGGYKMQGARGCVARSWVSCLATCMAYHMLGYVLMGCAGRAVAGLCD